MDITEAKKSQDAKLAEFNDILAATPSCLKVINSKGELIEMNAQGLELIEAESIESVYRADVYSLVTDEFREEFIEINNPLAL